MLKHIVKLHVVGLLVMSILRIAHLIANHSLALSESAGQTTLWLIALLRGVWFDNVIACYISILPLVVIWIVGIFGVKSWTLNRTLHVFVQVLTIVAMIVSAANIAYFPYFFKTINASIFQWFEHGTTTASMVLGESQYYPPILLLFALVFCYVWFTNRLFDKTAVETRFVPARFRHSLVCHILLGALLVGSCLFGIRGRVGYNPIKVSAAWFCNDNFLNQAGVSPTFNLLTSYLDSRRPENRRLHLMDGKMAIPEAASILGRNPHSDKPLAYKVKAATVGDRFFLNRNEAGSDDLLNADAAQNPKLTEKPNVVLILMESMSAKLMTAFGNDKNLTPFLDSLATQSVFFTNTYSTGIHTNHGIFSTLYSFPALMFRNLMKGSVIPNYRGLPQELRDNGYNTLFFMTHESQYDNMNAFLRTNGFNEIYAQEDYPASERVNAFGVSDYFLYDYALNKFSTLDTPFFATLLSISNHPPYIIPEKYQARVGGENMKEEDRIVRYADAALSDFFAEAKKQPWFENTVFVLLGDHGKLVGNGENELPESFNHIPLMIYSKMLSPRKEEGWTSQMDIQPTILSLLGIEAELENFGVDRVHRDRPFIFYTADTQIAARDSSTLFIYIPSEDVERVYPADSDARWLKHGAFSMLQAAEEFNRQSEE